MTSIIPKRLTERFRRALDAFALDPNKTTVVVHHFTAEHLAERYEKLFGPVPDDGFRLPSIPPPGLKHVTERPIKRLG